MKIEIEFEELQELKNTVENQSNKIKELEYKLSKAQPNEIAKKMASEYIARFFNSFGIEHEEGETEFWTSPPGTDWKGTCNVGFVFSKKGDEPTKFSATVRYLE